jgi:hypothetical protein
MNRPVNPYSLELERDTALYPDPGTKRASLELTGVEQVVKISWGKASQMKHLESDISILVEMIDSLQEPYRENVINWLRSCSQGPMHDLQAEIKGFMGGLTSFEQEYFVRDMRVLLNKATRYFGVQGLNGARNGRKRGASRGVQVFWNPLD